MGEWLQPIRNLLQYPDENQPKLLLFLGLRILKGYASAPQHVNDVLP